jgi:hypothetical protein
MDKIDIECDWPFPSARAFCGSILAAVWLQRDDLVKSGSFLLAGFSLVLTVFFAGIVIFGIVAIEYLKKFHKDIFALAKELNQEGVFCTEVIYFKRAMEIGTGSFTLIFIAWIILCIRLWIEYWHK